MAQVRHKNLMMWRYQCDARDERDEGDTDELKDVDAEYKEGKLVEGVRAVVVEHNGGKAENPLEDVVRDRVDVRREHDWRRNWILWWKNGRNYFVERAEPPVDDSEAALLYDLTPVPAGAASSGNANAEKAKS